METMAYVISLLDRATAIERHAAKNAIRLPRDLGRARRAMRAALLRATCPDALGLADDLHDATARLIAQGRAGEVLRARRDLALTTARAYRPDAITPEIEEAINTLAAAVARAEAIARPRVEA